MSHLFYEQSENENQFLNLELNWMRDSAFLLMICFTSPHERYIFNFDRLVILRSRIHDFMDLHDFYPMRCLKLVFLVMNIVIYL